MREPGNYPTEPLKCWGKAKELRPKFYEAYIKAHERGGIRYAGSTGGPHGFMCGFGKDVYNLCGEPYGATIAWHKDFAVQCEEACEKKGIARDLCGYLRNYWGSVILDKFILPDGTIIDEFPKPDLSITFHLCCSHAKWYQYACELEGDVPLFAIDISGRGNIWKGYEEHSINYLTQQLSEAIEWGEKVTGRKFNDELFIEGFNNEIESGSRWAEVCTYNQAIPAPLDEKTMYSLYVFNAMCPQWKESADFYRELRDEVADRVSRGIAAVAKERYRIMTDSQPPWAFLNIFRFMEREYGVVSLGSITYESGFACWDMTEDGKLVPLKTPKELGLEIKNREDALRIYAEYRIGGWRLFNIWCSSQMKSELLKKGVEQWKADAVIFHLNKGCEGVAIGQMENRLDLIEAGIPVTTFEGNMADSRDFDYARTLSRIETFLQSQGLEKLNL